MNKIFLAGPISGVAADVAEREFGKYEDELISRGFSVYNPIRELRNAGMLDAAWHEILRFSLKHMMADCKELHLLPGWQKSKGAVIEHDLANALQIPIFYLEAEESISA